MYSRRKKEFELNQNYNPLNDSISSDDSSIEYSNHFTRDSKPKKRIYFTNPLKKINCPTLLIWGDKDTAVPINRAYELNKLIKNSKLIVYENCTHYAYLEKLDEVCNEINNFIK